MMSRLVVLAFAAALLPLAPLVPAAHAPACTNTSPANDCIANATPITTSFVNLWASNTGATVEPHEPGVGPDNQFTIWWKFTAFRDSDGSFGVGDSDHQATHSVWELQPDGSFEYMDGASGWTSLPWSYFQCEAGKTYYVQAGGEEGQFGTINLYGGPCQLGPEAPRAPSLTVSPGPALGEISLAWSLGDDGGAPVTGWALHRGDVGTCGGGSVIATPSAGVSTYTDSGLASGVYCYRIAAVNPVGEGDWSSSRATTPLGPPTAPRFLHATVTGTSSIALAWWEPAFDGGAGIDGYTLSVAPSADGPWETLATPTLREFTDGGLAAGTTRHYRLTASTALGEGPAATTSARTWSVTSAPRNVDTGPSFPFPTQVEVTWSAPADLGGRYVIDYTIYRAEKGETLRPIAVVPGSATSFVDDPPLLQGFDYAVSARNSVGESPLSGVACGEAFPVPPPFEGC